MPTYKPPRRGDPSRPSVERGTTDPAVLERFRTALARILELAPQAVRDKVAEILQRPPSGRHHAKTPETRAKLSAALLVFHARKRGKKKGRRTREKGKRPGIA